ncbi:hypothetical protein FYQ21_19210, partial [Salmonella enterica]|nr:hypothetical protein [Salmonella enterica]
MNRIFKVLWNAA